MVICKSEGGAAEELSGKNGHDQSREQAADLSQQLPSDEVDRKDQQSPHDRRHQGSHHIHQMTAGVPQAEDIREYGYSPAQQGSEVSRRSMREVGHGIEEEPMQVDDSAVGQHHMVPGIGLAAE